MRKNGKPFRHRTNTAHNPLLFTKEPNHDKFEWSMRAAFFRHVGSTSGKTWGGEFNNGLHDENVAKHQGAKSRWIIQGFHGPDIANLKRTVPTPETSDVPLALQMLASIRALAWIGDVKSALAQGIRNQRDEPFGASLPDDGAPGEEGDVVVELCAEIHGLGFKRHLGTLCGRHVRKH